MSGKKKAVGPSLTKHINLASGEKVVKFHMEGTAVVVESIDGDKDFDTKKLFPTEAENTEYLAEIDIISNEEGPKDEEKSDSELPEGFDEGSAATKAAGL